MDLVSLFLIGFVAATLVPIPSEFVLGALVAGSERDAWLLWTVATTGNTLGAVVNWVLARYLLRFRDRRWFPWPSGLDQATDRMRRWGEAGLLLAWMPILGDPLTFAAGLLRVPLVRFVPLVAVGKGARYAVVLWGLDAAQV